MSSLIGQQPGRGARTGRGGGDGGGRRGALVKLWG